MPMKQVISDINDVSEMCISHQVDCCSAARPPTIPNSYLEERQREWLQDQWPHEVYYPSQDCPKVLSCPWNMSSVISMCLGCVSLTPSWLLFSCQASYYSYLFLPRRETERMASRSVATWRLLPIPRLSQGVIMSMKQVISDINVSGMCISPSWLAIRAPVNCHDSYL